MRKIQIKRGLKANMPTLSEGELGFATDDKELYIGTDEGNKFIGASPIQIQTMTLVASGWSLERYSLESMYPATTYDITIEPNNTCTKIQLAAWSAANIVGNATSNTIRAFGTVPTVDIPVIIKAVKK